MDSSLRFILASLRRSSFKALAENQSFVATASVVPDTCGTYSTSAME